jgi:hypothetical protein
MLVTRRRGGMICDVIYYPPSSLEEPPLLHSSSALLPRGGAPLLLVGASWRLPHLFLVLVSWGEVSLVFLVWESLRWQVLMWIQGTSRLSSWRSTACKVKSCLAKVGLPPNLSFSRSLLASRVILMLFLLLASCEACRSLGWFPCSCS